MHVKTPTKYLLLPATLFLISHADAQTVSVPIGDGALPNQIGDGFVTAADNGGLLPETGSMWGVTNNTGNRFGLIYDSYSNIAAGTLPSTIQAGRYVFTARVGNNGLGGGGFAGLNDISIGTSTAKGLVAGFFSTVVNDNGGNRVDAQSTKNNMSTEWNGLPSVGYTPPPEANPGEDAFTTWTFTWDVAADSPLIGTNPNFGVFTRTGNTGGNGFWDDSTLTYTINTDPPVIDSFIASPSTLLDDRNVTLTWTTSNTTSVSIDQSVGSVGLNDSYELVVATSSLPLTFTLTATNSNATPPNDVATAQVTITARSLTEAPALMACWPFDGDLTEQVFGWSATEDNGSDGFDDITFVSDVPAAISSRRTQSIHFGALNVDDSITTGFAGVSGFTSRSVSYWIKTNDLNAICPFSYGQNNEGRAFLNRIDPDGIVRLGFRQATEIVTPSNTVTLDTWTHIALVYAGLDGDAYENATIYVNGTRYNQAGFVGDYPVSTVQRPLEFGRDVTRTGIDAALLHDVSLSEWTFFRGELTSSQVATLAAGGDPKMLDGSPTPSIPSVKLSFASSAPVDATSTTFSINYAATEGSVFELWTSTDLATDWSVVNSNIVGTGATATLNPTIDPTTEPKRFFQLRQK